MSKISVEFWEEIKPKTIIGTWRTGYFHNFKPIIIVTIDGEPIATECIVRNSGGQKYITWRKAKI